MEQKKVPGWKISGVIALQIIGSSMVIGSGSDAKQDSWLAVAAAVVLSLGLAWVYSRVLRRYPGKDLFGAALKAFGPAAGKIFCGIYFFYAIFLAAQVFRVMNEFIQLVNLPKTPQAAVLALAIPVVAAQARGGLKNLASCARFLLPILIITTVSTFLLGIRFMDPENLQPILGSGWQDLAKGTFSSLTVPLGETVLSLSFFGEAEPKDDPFRVLAAGLLTGGGIMVLVMLRNLMLLGAPTCRLFIFASYDAVGVISVGQFITRISVLIGINLVLAATVKLGAFVYAASQGISSILGLRDRMLPALPCAVLAASLGYVLYDNLLTGFSFLKYLPAFSVPFQFIFPLLLLLPPLNPPLKRRKRNF